MKETILNVLLFFSVSALSLIGGIYLVKVSWRSTENK